MKDSLTSNVGTRGVITNASKSIHVSCCFVVLTLATLLNSAWAGVCNGDHICTGKETAKNCPSDCTDGGGGGGGNTGSTAPDPYNLARASFATRSELTELGDPPGGVFADDVGHCRGYDYWDWQEALLPSDVGLVECQTYLNSSNVSGGGRWFLISGAAGSEEVVEKIERWLVVDFSTSTDGATCHDLDNVLYLDDPDQIAEDDDLCVDSLAVRLSADRILKAKANQQALEFSIRWRPDPLASIYWPAWGYVSYIQPLYLRDPSIDDPDDWIGCRVMSTRPAATASHDRAEAELLREIAPGQTELLGTYYLPLEVCVKRASD